MSVFNNQIVPYGTASTPVELGALVRLRRHELGATQVEAAGLCGVGVRFLSELERGKETAELGKVMRVLARLGLRVSIAPRSGADR